MTGAPPNTQFLAFIVLDRATVLDPKRIVESVRNKTVKDKSTVEIMGEVKTGHPLMLDINGALYTVMQVDRPLPPDAYEMALRLNRSWSQAGEVVAQCKAHLIVAPVLPTNGVHSAALQAAVDLTRLCAALVEIEGARAVVWTTGDVLVEAPRFGLAANELVQKRIPLMSWINLIPVLGPKTEKGEQTFAVLTSGLQPFIGREVEFPPSTMKSEEITKRVLGFAHLLILRGPFVKDGETIGISANDFIVVKEQPQGQRPGIPVFSLSPKGA